MKASDGEVALAEKPGHSRGLNGVARIQLRQSFSGSTAFRDENLTLAGNVSRMTSNEEKFFQRASNRNSS